MIIAIGGSGLIGRYLTHKMVQEGMDILAVGRSKQGEAFCKENNIPFMRLDITNIEDFEKLPQKNVDAVVHLAALLAELRPSVEELLRGNVLGTYNVLEYCKNVGVKKIIYTTSHKEVMDWWAPQYLPISESVPERFSGPESPYVISKIAGKRFVEFYATEYGIQGVVLRLTGVRGYGEILGSLNSDGSYVKSAFEMFVENAIKGEPIEIWGNHTARRDHIYIKDVVSCILAALRSDKVAGLYNVASGTGVTIEDEVKAIIKVFSPPENPSQIIYRPDIADLTKSWVYEISKAKTDLDWTPRYSYEEMLMDYKKESQRKKYHHFHFVNEKDRPIYW
jgi:UDP-glucose 4-epimerase